MPTPPTASNPANDQAPEKRSRRRLVPDLSDTIAVSGQSLVRVAREESSDGAAPPPLTMEDIARKHLAPADARVIEENGDFLRALRDADAEPVVPSRAQEIAERMELFTDGAQVVPHPEPDPEKRPDSMSVSPIVGLPDETDFLAGKAAPQTIFDLFSLFPQLDGDNWFIYVERKIPKTYLGLKVDGMLRKISAPLTLEQWKYWYGGGTYKLIVYGPSKRSAVHLGADGRVQPKALTEPITVVFPGVPSCESEVYDGDDDMTAPSQQGFPNIPLGGRRGPASMADANIEKERITVDAAREVRGETREERERARAEKALEAKAAGESQLMQMFLVSQEKAAQREADLRQQMLERERELTEQRLADREEFERRQRELEKRKPETDDFDRVAKIAGIMQKPDNSDALKESHARELERIQAGARADADRAAAQVKDAEARADRRIADAESRAAERIREIEKRFEGLERDLRDRTDRELARVKDESERRINDMHHRHTEAIASEARNHERDLASRTAQHAMALESQKNTYEMRLETAKSEVKRTGTEIDRWKKEAEANKDPIARIRQIKENAEELGMIPGDQAGAEPQTVPQMLMQMGAGLVQNLPGIVQNVGELFKARSQQDLQAARLAGRAEMVEQAGQFAGPGGAQRALPQSPMRRRAAQLEGGYVPRHMSEVPPTPIQPGVNPYAVATEQQQYQPVPMPQEAPAPTADLGPAQPQYVVPAPAPAPQPMQPLASVFPQPSVPPPTMVQIPPPPAISGPAPSVPPPAPPSAVIDPQELLLDKNILQAEQMITPPYTSAMPAALLAEQMWSNFGPENITNMVENVDAERVVLAIQRSGDPESPFLRRDGKKYLRALFDELKKKVSGA